MSDEESKVGENTRLAPLEREVGRETPSAFLDLLRCPECGSFNTFIFLRPQHRLVTEGDSFWFVSLSEKVCEMCGHRWDRKENEGVRATWA